MAALTGPANHYVCEGAGLDFRDEIMAQIYDRGDVRPKRTLTFNIDVTDDGETHGPPFRERRTFRDWRRIGTITVDRAVVHTMAISSSISVIRRGVTTKTIPQLPRASTDERCAEIAAMQRGAHRRCVSHSRRTTELSGCHARSTGLSSPARVRCAAYSVGCL